jgi:DNA invertase Pin-like site-specific DNA recombinase
MPGLLSGIWSLGNRKFRKITFAQRGRDAERVRAGLARARSEGKRLGRPPIAPALEKRIRQALATPGRPGVRVIAKQFGVDPGTVQRISRPFVDASVAVG